MVYYYIESEYRSVDGLTPDYDKATALLERAKFLMPNEHWKLRFFVQ